MSDVPYVVIGNEELANRPKLRDGDWIRCPTCGKEHQVTSIESDPPGMTMEFYHCDDKQYMAGINGVSTMGMKLSGGKVDLSGDAE